MWSNVRKPFGLVLLLGLGLSASPSCAPASAPADSQDLSEDAVASGEGVTGSLAVGTELKATGNVNLRSSASTSASVLHVVASGSIVTVQASTPSNGFYKVKHNGTVGWSYGKYYEPVSTPSGSIGTGAILTATGDVNLRSGPSTADQILDVVTAGSHVTTVDSSLDNGYYHVDFNGTVGYSSSKYYKLESSGSGGSGGGGSGGSGSGGTSGAGGSGTGGSTGNSIIDQAMTRAKAGVGFSYWWGHGRFRPEGPGSSPGSCSGSCPSCSHSGSYGGDCSGFVAKVWQVPSSNTDLTDDEHPYSTENFNGDTSQWKTVSRGSLKMADALVYRGSTGGHVFIYSSGDGWGSMYAYECKGCSAGCIKGYRTASSAYHGIRRAGF